MDYRDERRRRDSRGRYMRDRGYEPRYDRRYDDYEERVYREEMRHDRRYDDYDRHEDMEYNECLSKHEMHEWAEHLENADGSHGAKFGKEQIISIARAQGIQFHDFTEDELVMTANMLYSDYCKVLPNSDAVVYVRMAKAFLEDEDAAVKGGEKLAKYYDDFVR